MQFFEYYLLYAFNWTLLLSLGLSIFRFNLKHYYYQIIVSALLLSYVSANIQYFDKGFLTAIVQPICAILCLRLIFRIHWAHSIIIIGLSYGINIFAEFAITWAISYFHLSTAISYMQRNDILTIGICITFFNVISCFILHKFRIGFTFIAARQRKTFEYKGLNKQILSLSIICVILVLGSGFIIFFFEEFVLLKNVLLIGVWLMVLRVAYQKDVTE
ncbi:hypothetical protein RAC89_04990 [Paenibacillus sp. GD4]|uniref:hypothetical protein n=1 Tax=Paenibacillus sp. GD4 TaxID=3068890 RepID=UPI0027968F7B|nr:hypothetical protein [Paenibacillus sp. GD4]MDQ1909862.1 hypothetical protein [Paenibacillus sp. GD4]